MVLYGSLASAKSRGRRLWRCRICRIAWQGMAAVTKPDRDTVRQCTIKNPPFVLTKIWQHFINIYLGHSFVGCRIFMDFPDWLDLNHSLIPHQYGVLNLMLIHRLVLAIVRCLRVFCRFRRIRQSPQRITFSENRRPTKSHASSFCIIIF